MSVVSNDIKKSLVVVGAGGHAANVTTVAKANGYDIRAYVDNSKNGQTLFDTPIIESIDDLGDYQEYVYVIAIFALLSGVFFPLITTGAEEAFNFVIGGTATLLLGLAGGIVLFKATTSDKRQGILLSIGSALIAISLVLIFQIHDWFRSVFF